MDPFAIVPIGISAVSFLFSAYVWKRSQQDSQSARVAQHQADLAALTTSVKVLEERVANEIEGTNRLLDRIEDQVTVIQAWLRKERL